jgi:hypothetical protein
VRQQGEAATVSEIPDWVMQSGGIFRQKSSCGQTNLKLNLSRNL